MGLKGINIGGTTYQMDYNYLDNKPEALPTVSSSDAGKILKVSDAGAWIAAAVPNAEEASF